MRPIQSDDYGSIEAEAASWFTRNRNRPDEQTRAQFDARRSITLTGLSGGLPGPTGGI